MSIYEHADPETSISMMKSKHQGNNVIAILLDKELSQEDKVQALGNIQKEMNKREGEDIKRLWGKMSRATGRDLTMPKLGFTDMIHAILKNSFDRATGIPTEWDIEHGVDPKYEPDLTLALYIGQILVLYRQKYPEYC